MKTLLKDIVLLCSFVALLGFTSCNDNANVLPGVTGKFGEIYVITESNIWDSEVGDTIRSIFTEYYPMLPQDEARFNLFSVPYSNFSRAFQRHRNLIIVDIKPEETEPKVSVLYDRWATPQIVITVTGCDKHSIAEQLYLKKASLLAYVEQAELDRQSSNMIKYEDHSLREAVEKKFGVRIFIQKGFRQLPVDPQANFLWFSNRNTYVDMGMFIYTFPFTSDSTFTVDYLVHVRNLFLKEFVPLDPGNSWMTTSLALNPTLEVKSFKGQTYGEMRGLWEVENDFMGGPFISRSYVDNEKQRIVVVEGYVYAARYDKRDYMRRLEGIINTFTLTIPKDSQESGDNK